MHIKDAIKELLEGNSLTDAIDSLLEADAGIQKILKELKASDWSDEDLARRLYSEAKRKRTSLDITISSTTHRIVKWWPSGQITTQSFHWNGPTLVSRFYNHSSWADLASNDGFRVAIL